jgi:antitoxin HigA-1
MKTTTKEPARMKDPMHPGILLRSEIIEAYGLNVTEAAKILGVGRPALSNFLNGNAALSGEMAVRFEKAFGLSMETLMRIQNAWDIARTRELAGEINVERFKQKVA